jgi:hypothetical protein
LNHNPLVLDATGSREQIVIWGALISHCSIGGGLGFLKGRERRLTDSPKECRTCVWWSHNKVAKAGECNRVAGIIVSHPTTGTRTAYPKTVSDESCDHHREKK